MKITVITGSRAEYGLLAPLIRALKDEPAFDVQVVATGAHLSPAFGLSYRDILADGFEIDRTVEMLLSSDTDTAIAKSTGLGFIGFADALSEMRPDRVIVLGDRYEIFAAAASAYLLRIPV